ncbi:hypothetical protein ACFLWZ_04720 [Chloroflexota bacterium]
MRLIAFILLIIGTVGLLLNELILDWGTVAVIIFAICNLVGLVTLAGYYVWERSL